MTPDTETLFFDYVELVTEGGAPAFDEWVGSYPDQAAELHLAWSDYLRAVGELDSGDAQRVGSSRLGVGTTIGEFELVRLLGRGGQGSVWEAKQADLNRRVALKILASERTSETDLERFRREALAGARLHHPGIVAVHAAGQSDGMAWIAQELVATGRTLRHRIDEVRNAPELPKDWYHTCAELIRDVALALAEAHGAGIVHRDLKPQNILLTQDGRPKVGDFGLARLDDSTALSVTGQVLGTYFYMSPEQVEGRSELVRPSTDVFSLGVVLYELLTLQRPFQGDTSHQICTQILEWDPPEPRSIREQVPRDLSLIALAAIEKDPRRRYAGMLALADDLRRYLDQEPIEARPTGLLRRFGKWARRHPVRTAVAAVTTVAFAAITWALVELFHARNEAATEANRANAALADARSREDELGALLDQLLNEVHFGLDELLGSAKAQELITETALRYIQTLERSRRGDPELSLRLAVANMRVGGMRSGVNWNGIGDPEMGREYNDRAIEILRDLRTSLPESGDLYRRVVDELGNALVNSAHCEYELSRAGIALSLVGEALALWGQFGEAEDLDGPQLNDRARALELYAILLNEMDQRERATQARWEMLDLSRRMYEATGNPINLVLAAGSLASSLVQDKRTTEARSVLDGVLEIVESPEWRNDAGLKRRAAHASHDRNSGVVLQAEGRLAESIDALEAAARQYRELYRLDSGNQAAIENALGALALVIASGFLLGTDSSHPPEMQRKGLVAALSACREAQAIGEGLADALPERWLVQLLSFGPMQAHIEAALKQL